MRKLGEIIFEVIDLRDDLAQLPEVGWVEEEVDVWEAGPQLLLLIGHHAAGQHDRDRWFLPLQPDERVQLAGDLVFGRLADDAGVQDDDIGLILLVGAPVASFLERGRDLGAVRLVHLATNGPNEEALAVVRCCRRRGRRIERDDWERRHPVLLTCLIDPVASAWRRTYDVEMRPR